MIGNDIVGLQLASASRWKEERFGKKIFSEEELGFINGSTSKMRSFWQFWSMKEAAYKAHQRRFALKRKFNPMDFECKIAALENNPIHGRVRIKKWTYVTTTLIEKDFIFSTATGQPDTKLIQKTFTNTINLKSAFLKEVSSILSIESFHLKLKKNKENIPFLFCEKEQIPLSFSFSHHGGFSAYSFAVNELLKSG